MLRCCLQEGGTDENIAAKFMGPDAPAADAPPPGYLSPPPAPGDYDAAYADTLTASLTSVLIVYTAPSADGDSSPASVAFLPHMLAALARPQPRFHCALLSILRSLDVFLEVCPHVAVCNDVCCMGRLVPDGSCDTATHAHGAGAAAAVSHCALLSSLRSLNVFLEVCPLRIRLLVCNLFAVREDWPQLMLAALMRLPRFSSALLSPVCAHP